MHLEVKICGLTRLEDAITAAEAGADFAGFILYEKSPRYIAPQEIRRICRHIAGSIKPVGVFVNSSRDFVLKVIEECDLYAVQFHGDENIADYLPLPALAWKAVRIGPSSKTLPPDAAMAERLVIDTFSAGLYGGTGITVDLGAAAEAAGSSRIMLGGGMTPDNVAAAVARIRPYGVDVSSGVEKKPGVKDPAKIRKFIQAARSVC